jgi:hypothetical protein
MQDPEIMPVHVHRVSGHTHWVVDNVGNGVVVSGAVDIAFSWECGIAAISLL